MRLHSVWLHFKFAALNDGTLKLAGVGGVLAMLVAVIVVGKVDADAVGVGIFFFVFFVSALLRDCSLCWDR